MGICEACRILNCQNCDVSLDRCETCRDGFIKGADIQIAGAEGCILCIEGCVRCKDNQRCERCALLYTLNQNLICERSGVVIVFLILGVVALFVCVGFLAHYLYKKYEKRSIEKRMKFFKDKMDVAQQKTKIPPNYPQLNPVLFSIGGEIRGSEANPDTVVQQMPQGWIGSKDTQPDFAGPTYIA